jgi:hypothetical protein
MLKKENVMKNKKTNKTDDLRSNYIFDYSKAVRGKHYQRLMKEGTNVVVLEPDIAKVFRGSAAVNDALRSLLASMYVGSPAESALCSVGCMSIDPTPCPCTAVRTPTVRT